ncbi:dihydrofolate reductase family protein [Saccharopolyspora phatthalungensis]|uniref:Dihydrofolate reductase n=1 Tax=Saccharopolyspora phatthalungensis TaxID=664693 RepID=A0A840QIY5_9PSEU|nr:dihydrofolate reductase family protein [Saccharopolyspora phatthalungensis]MBB5158769.1 dihydrofolate reductase [Saccharopolyspora phatthalungensis]
MSAVSCHLGMSLDGFAAGPNQSPKDPVGVGGMRLHQWVFPTRAWHEHRGLEGGARSVDSEVLAEVIQGIGAYIMGRRMFGGGDGPWDESWRGWWGEEPSFHAPVFVLTHHPREPLEMRGGTTFTFVTDGIESALRQARKAAGDRDVSIAGGAQTVQQFLAAGLLDELFIHLVPIVLGAGERLLDNVGNPTLEPVTVVPSEAVTHIKYRVVH